MTFTLAVDAMGGDLGPRVTLKAVQQILAEHSDLSIQYYISSSESSWLDDELSNSASYSAAVNSRLHIHYCEQAVEMTDKPSHALRRKQQSTMALALKSIANNETSACISCGNTGALLALSRYTLSTFIDIDRPAMARDIPTVAKPLLLLDLGANIDVGAEGLLQFAVLGVAWRKAQGLQKPRLGVLNIGKEASKGTEEIRLAGQLICELEGIEYAGFVEADELYRGELDIVVCDGFHGNIALKTSEGLLTHVSQQFELLLKSSLLGRGLSFFANPLIERFKRQLDPVLHSGALLLGVNGLVVKSHGKSDQEAFYQSLRYALLQAKSGSDQRLSRELDKLAI
ncbi:MAG: phosphate acyltransferase PlsX [Oleispira sp.]|nr:phosphate acyltransferase PlsX [Oleispira sp.]